MPKPFPLSDKLLVTGPEVCHMLSICPNTLTARRRDPRDPLSQIPVIPGSPHKFHIKDVRKVAKAYRKAALALMDSA